MTGANEPACSFGRNPGFVKLTARRPLLHKICRQGRVAGEIEDQGIADPLCLPVNRTGTGNKTSNTNAHTGEMFL